MINPLLLLTSLSFAAGIVAPVYVRDEQHETWSQLRVVVGSNFINSNAQNELTMWQEETWDPITLQRELKYASELGFNGVRVFLHNLLHENDPEGLFGRMEAFNDLCDKVNIGIIYVLLDSCWKPNPLNGTQPEPTPYVHNSVWMQSPGLDIVSDITVFNATVKPYVSEVISRFSSDPRIIAWDVWNEPNNDNGHNDNEKIDFPALLSAVFEWAREANPSQPITSPIWQGENWDDYANLSEVQKIQINHSDIISFHNYEPLELLATKVERLKTYEKPIICTEYMARKMNSYFNPNLGYMVGEGVSAMNWGLVTGKTQTCYPWDSNGEVNPYEGVEPEDLDWFHDILFADGTPKYPEEKEYIKLITGSIF